MAGSSGEGRALPEVPLRWSEFSWSLEKLRHKTYTKNATERDWFRINPLEMVLLGCQTLSSGLPARRNHGTMVLVMESIGAPMRLRPRYWKRLLTVLVRTCEGDLSPLVLQRCVSNLAALWKSLMNVPEFQPALYAWGVGEVSIISFLEGLTQNKTIDLGLQGMHEVKSLLVDIQEALFASKQPLHESSTGREEEKLLDHLLAQVLQNTLSGSRFESITLELLLMRRCCSKILREEGYDLFCLPYNPTTATFNVKKLLETVKALSSFSDLSRSLSHILGIIQLLNIRWKECPEESACVKSSTDGEQVKPVAINTLVDKLIAALTTALETWGNMHVTVIPHQSSSCRVVSQLLCLAHVMLASGAIQETLATTTYFFGQTISLLMIYSTEGYLSNSPCEFLLELIEYVSSLVEQGVPPEAVVHTNLPNLFGPTFGTRHHSVSCKLLEYGYLAACSQHQKSLLSEGLSFLVDAYHLFPPIDKARIKLAAKIRREQVVGIVYAILDDIITRVVRVSDEPADGSGREDGVARVRGHNEMEEAMVYGTHRGGQSHGQDDSEYLIEVTDAERESENQSRLQILLRLLELACAMIRNGDNTCFLFASVLPKLFSGSLPTSLIEISQLHQIQPEKPSICTSVPWQVDKKEFALWLLELATLSVENDVASPFQICGVVAPKLVQNIDTLNLPDHEKISITTEIFSLTCESLRKGQYISELISHGIDLLASLLPELATSEDLRQMIHKLAKQLVAFTQASLLFMLKQSCSFMLMHFPDKKLAIQELFRALIFRGKRDEIRGIFRLCRKDFEFDKYSEIRECLYTLSSGAIKHRQLISMCGIVVAIMDVEKPPKGGAIPPVEGGGVLNGEEESNAEIASVVRKLTQPCLEKLVAHLSSGRFRKEDWEQIAGEVSRIALFRTLFNSEFSTFSNLSSAEIIRIFQSKFPPDVLADEEMMNLLALCGARIEHMQVPRYHSLKMLLSKVLQYFLTQNVQQEMTHMTSKQLQVTDDTGIKKSHTNTGPLINLLAARVTYLHHYLVESFPRNKSDRSKLVEYGYSNGLWNEVKMHHIHFYMHTQLLASIMFYKRNKSRDGIKHRRQDRDDFM